MCAPEIRSSLDRPDYWVECRPCDFRSEDFLNFKDCAAAYAEHEFSSALIETQIEYRDALERLGDA